MNGELPGDGGILEPGQALDRLAAWKGRIDRLAADTQTMSTRMQDVRVTVSDDNGLARVTVDATGGLVDLWLGPRIQRVAPETVSATVMTLVRQARTQLAARAQEIVAETLGTDSPAARDIAERVGRQLAGPDPGAAGAADPSGADDWRRAR